MDIMNNPPHNKDYGSLSYLLQAMEASCFAGESEDTQQYDDTAEKNDTSQDDVKNSNFVRSDQIEFLDEGASQKDQSLDCNEISENEFNSESEQHNIRNEQTGKSGDRSTDDAAEGKVKEKVKDCLPNDEKPVKFTRSILKKSVTKNIIKTLNFNKSILKSKKSSGKNKKRHHSKRNTEKTNLKIQAIAEKERTEKSHLCATCGLMFDRPGRLKNHYNAVHTNAKAHVCSICGEKFRLKLQFNAHVKSHNENRRFKCETCGLSFNYKHVLQKHQASVHLREKPFRCNFEDCGQLFAREHHLTNHMLRHTDTKPFECRPCGKKFRQISNLKSHEDRCHEKSLCQYCGVQIFSGDNGKALQEHVSSCRANNVQSSTFSQTCLFCNISFTQQSEYDSHMAAMHSDQFSSIFNRLQHHSIPTSNSNTLTSDSQSFSCHVCSKTFRNESSYVEHTRTHTGDKPFKCDLCLRYFISNSKLRRHWKMKHSTEMLYNCHVCNEKFHEAVKLRRHFHENHSVADKEPINPAVTTTVPTQGVVRDKPNDKQQRNWRTDIITPSSGTKASPPVSLSAHAHSPPAGWRPDIIMPSVVASASPPVAPAHTQSSQSSWRTDIITPAAMMKASAPIPPPRTQSQQTNSAFSFVGVPTGHAAYAAPISVAPHCPPAQPILPFGNRHSDPNQQNYFSPPLSSTYPQALPSCQSHQPVPDHPVTTSAGSHHPFEQNVASNVHPSYPTDCASNISFGTAVGPRAPFSMPSCSRYDMQHGSSCANSWLPNSTYGNLGLSVSRGESFTEQLLSESWPWHGVVIGSYDTHQKGDQNKFLVVSNKVYQDKVDDDYTTTSSPDVQRTNCSSMASSVCNDDSFIHGNNRMQNVLQTGDHTGPTSLAPPTTGFVNNYIQQSWTQASPTTTQPDVRQMSETNEALPGLADLQSNPRRRTYSNANKFDDKTKVLLCSACGMMFDRPSRLKSHYQAVHTTANLHSCPLCGIKFKLRNQLKAHVASHSEDRKFKCETCGLAFNYKHVLEKHQSSVHLRHKPFSCLTCGMVFAREHHLSSHMKTHSNLRPFICSICGKNFAHKGNLKLHLRIHEEDKIGCDSCKLRFRNAETLERHKKRMHYEGRLKCDVCNRTFCDDFTLKEHKSTHTGEILYHCMYCDAGFHWRSSYNAHVKRIHTGYRPHGCAQCDMSFMKPSQLREHVRIVHDGDNEHVKCTECGKVLSSVNALNEHLNLHKGIKPLECPSCDKTFRHKSSLLYHVRSHSGKKPFRCDECKLTFMRRSRLSRHKKEKHSDERPHECVKCDKAFKRAYLLQKHMLTHEDDSEHPDFTDADVKPVKRRGRPNSRMHFCKVCERPFNRVVQLQRHVKTHKRKKQRDKIPEYCCEICKRSFPTNRLLQKHVLDHSLGDPLTTLDDGSDDMHTCYICNRKYRRNSILRSHIRREHSNFSDSDKDSASEFSEELGDDCSVSNEQDNMDADSDKDDESKPDLNSDKPPSSTEEDCSHKPVKSAPVNTFSDTNSVQAEADVKHVNENSFTIKDESEMRTT